MTNSHGRFIITRKVKHDRLDVERDGTLYFCGHSVKGTWSNDPDDATRFLSAERASKVIVQLEYIAPTTDATIVRV